MKQSLVNCDALGAREAKKARATGPFPQFQHLHPFAGVIIQHLYMSAMLKGRYLVRRHPVSVIS